MYDLGLLFITGFFMLVGILISSRLKGKFATYTADRLSSGLSGREVAEKMLWENGIYDVKVTSVNGILSDHYNPANKTVNLSHDVFHGVNVAAAAVAAHECGHAIQHSTAYKWLNLRSSLVPVVQMAGNLMSFLTLGLAFVAYSMSPQITNTMLLVFIVLQSAITLFSLITLPVEIDASQRALAWLNRSDITQSHEHHNAKDALKWAAYTYFSAALGSVAALFYYIWRFTSNKRD